MWNPCESHIPLNGCKDTNFSRTLQTFHTFSLNKYAFTLKSESKKPKTIMFKYSLYLIAHSERLIFDKITK